MKKLIENYTIGADIELFLQDKQTGEIVSAEGYIQGTKHEPFNFDPANKYFATSLDNVLAEFCIPPVNNPFLFAQYVEKVVGYINSVIPEHLCTVAMPSAVLADKYLQTENAQTFGCDPDLNVWLKRPNPKPEAKNKNLRSAGGHIHVGYANHSMQVSEKIVKAMDLFLGVPSVLQEPENERKSLYGKAGACRFKEEYGVEYRTISNYYLQSKELINWAYRSTERAINFINDGNGEVLDDIGTLIQSAINDNNKVIAGNLIRQYELETV